MMKHWEWCVRRMPRVCGERAGSEGERGWYLKPIQITLLDHGSIQIHNYPALRWGKLGMGMGKWRVAVTGLLMHSLMGWKVQKLGKGLEALGIGCAALGAARGW